MNESLQDKLDRLTIELKERRRHYRNSLRNMLFFCVIILTFFALYSALISYKIREVATPSTVALLIADQLQGQYSNQQNWNHDDYRHFAEDTVRSVLLSLPTGVHTAGEMLKDSMRQDARMAALGIADSLSASVCRNLGRITEEPAGKLAKRILDGTDMDPLIAAGKTLMFPVPFSFGERLREIRLKNGRALTRQDLCDRDFMLCWLFLSENERYQDSRCSNLMNWSLLLVRSWAESAGESLSQGQKNTKNDPVSRNTPARK